MKKDISKWQTTSQRVTDLRYNLEEILDNDFTEEEKQSLRYRQLVESVQNQLDFAVWHSTGNKKRNRFAWFSWQTLFLILGSPTVVESIKLLWQTLGGS